MKLLLATHNLGKKTELEQLLDTNSLTLVTLSELAETAHLTLPETAETFQDNALSKARTAAHASSLLTLADDSGLSVDALGGFPGVHSARWYQGSDVDRCRALLEKLANTTNRKARFECVLCLFDPRKSEAHFFSGSVEGSISDTPAGNNGFGYDSIFIPEGETQTFAQLPNEFKRANSHRARATEKLAAFLNQM